MLDYKDVIIEDMRRTLNSLERKLRAAGNVELKCYHDARDKELAQEFIKMADAAKESLDFSASHQFDL